jgi:hypothetical protein
VAGCSIFRATPSNGPCNGCCPHQNHYVTRHINKRYNNSSKLLAATQCTVKQPPGISLRLHIFVNVVIYIKCEITNIEVIPILRIKLQKDDTKASVFPYQGWAKHRVHKGVKEKQGECFIYHLSWSVHHNFEVM